MHAIHIITHQYYTNHFRYILTQHHIRHHYHHHHQSSFNIIILNFQSTICFVDILNDLSRMIQLIQIQHMRHECMHFNHRTMGIFHLFGSFSFYFSFPSQIIEMDAIERAPDWFKHFEFIYA